MALGCTPRAILTKELCGELAVRSDGPGCGAEFTLRASELARAVPGVGQRHGIATSIGAEMLGSGVGMSIRR